MNQKKLQFSAIWVSHFLLWTFSDMLCLVQKITEPANEMLLLLAAAPLAIIQVTMILLPLFGNRKIIRITTFCVAPVFVAFNINNYIDVAAGWSYLLTTAFIALNIFALIMAITWKKPDSSRAEK